MVRPAAGGLALPPAPLACSSGPCCAARSHRGAASASSGARAIVGGRQAAGSLSPATRRRFAVGGSAAAFAIAAAMLVESHAIQSSFSPASGLRSMHAQSALLLAALVH